jgi:outer membrane protein assembly factor BamB
LCRSLVLLACCSLAFAEGTRTWEQSKFDDLSKGTPKGVAIRSAGGLELAPAFKPLATTPSTYIWALASDRNGNAYAATGSPARVYRITADGQSAVIFEPQELQVQALAVDKNGALFAGTNPDGKVYRLEPGAKDAPWKSSVYFDPGTKYIWDLVLDDSGNLYVATGDKGEIYRVTPKGEHSVFFKSDEAHIRVLALDGKGNLIAGSDGSGLVYRISPSGEAFVLYSAAKKEITALAVAANGNIYAAGVGEKRNNTPSPITTITPTPTIPISAPGQTQPNIMMGAVGPNIQRTMNFPMPQLPTAGGSEIYCIAPDGSPSRIWTSHDDLVYAMAFDANGTLLAGTGNDGHIFAIAGEDRFTDLLRASASQVTAFAKAPAGGLYASTSNLGKLFRLGPGPEAEGTYESDVFDAHIFSRWGRAEVRSSGNIELFARSGNVDNPDRNWSPWSRVETKQDAPLEVPPARFVQWKAVLHAGTPAPRLDGVVLNYLSRNVAPDFDDVSVQPGVRYQPVPKPVGGDTTIITTSGTSSQPRFEPPPVTLHDPDSIGVKWTVHDDNDDDLVYSIYYRGDGETRWLLLKDDITDKFYAFDASLLPDSGYIVKVVASDAPSHSPGEGLTSERESSRFEVDTTPPRIENLAAAPDAGQIHVSFRASDSFSPIQRAEYSVDAGDWQYIEPADQISDSKAESYDFRARLPETGKQPASSSGGTDHVIVVRVYDRYDNMVSAKTLVHGQ